MKPTSNTELATRFQHVELAYDGEPVQPFQTGLTWGDRADLRLILKAASQSVAFNKQERDLAMRLIGELDQLPLEF